MPEREVPSTNGTAQRREPRYPVRLNVTLLRGKDASTVFTEDVSLRGVFLRTNDPPNLRQLVQIKLRLPPTNEEVSFHGMAVHVVPQDPANGRTPGVGIQFFTADPRERIRWEKFVKSVAERSGEPSAERRTEPSPATTTRRRHPRHDVKIRLWVKSLNHLHQIYTENVSKGGLLLATNERMPIGSKLQILVMHPVTKESFALEGIVRRHVSREHFRGVAVELDNVNDERRLEFMDFVAGAVDVPIDCIPLDENDDIPPNKRLQRS